MSRYHFMRHGRTNYNELSLCNDDPSRDVHLTAEGIAQAEGAAERLRHEPLERIICSQLPRTRQTAEIVNRHHGLAIESNPAVNDIRSGFDGLPVADYFAATAADPLHIRANGGESLLDHKGRIVAFLEWLVSRPEENILVVAHEESMRVFRQWFEGGIADDALRHLHFGNCEVITYERG